jgi:hypothetical protein
MQCHLGWCVSFRCDFTLEPFARGLPSEDADENAQPVVEATMGDASRCSMSSLAAAFNRRLSVNPSDHSTPKPSRSLEEKGLLAEDYSSDLPTN